MKLEINSIDVENELIKIKVNNDCNLKYYMICDTTYTSTGKISNELRHLYWFPATDVKKGDWIYLYSGKGKNTTWDNTSETTTYAFYWKLDSKVWNDTGDAAVLFELETWKTVQAL